MVGKLNYPFRRRVRKPDAAFPAVEISEENGIRSLHLESMTIQSSMDLDHPARLVLSYSRAMMAFLLWNEQPRHILQIGLGGGSLVRYIDEYLPEAVSVAVELNPQVIAVAKAFFCLPEESDFFELIEANGADYVKIFRQSTDVILVDGFDGVYLAEELTSQTFFEDCYRALTDNGLFVANWWSGDRQCERLLARLSVVFLGNVLILPASSHGNIIALAFRSKAAFLTPQKKLKLQARLLEKRFGLEFAEFASRLKSVESFIGHYRKEVGAARSK